MNHNRRSLAYEKDPSRIYAQSFATVQSEAKLARFPKDLQPVVTRLIHACGMVEIADRLAFSSDLQNSVFEAAQNGSTILCDCEAVASSIIARYLPQGVSVKTTLNDPRVAAHSQAIGNTRSAAAVDFWEDDIEGAIVAIGNAPTALFHLLELLDQGWPKPAAILGFPVGFVGAAESKSELAAFPRECEFITLRGRKGGSAMAAAAVNGLIAGLPELSQ